MTTLQGVPMKDKINLNYNSKISSQTGYQIVEFPKNSLDFELEILNLLTQTDFLSKKNRSTVQIKDLHNLINENDQRVDQYLLNNVSKSFYSTNLEFREKYLCLIKFLAQDLFNFDFLFQETPNIRFHFPVPLIDKYRNKDGLYLGHHCDSMLGHPLEEINCWLPLSECWGSATLQLMDLFNSISVLDDFAKFFDYDHEIFHRQGRDLFYEALANTPRLSDKTISKTLPINMSYGELLIFDSRCIHSPAENKESITRVSIDFRIIPVELYNNLKVDYISMGRSGRKYCKGDVFSSSTAQELLHGTINF